MKILILYDSKYGNTEIIARAVAKGFGCADKVTLMKAGQTEISDYSVFDLVIIGSPVHGGRPTQTLQDYLSGIPANAFKNTKFAVFDTRFLAAKQSFALRLLMNTIGYASPKMAKALISRGGKIVSEPQGFIVDGKSGPLGSGEIERATDWARKLLL